MSITFQGALDLLFNTAKGAIDANANAILGYAPDVRYPGVPKALPPDMDKFWIRVSAQIVTDGIAALASASGQRLYEAEGLLSIQLFCPRNIAGSRDAQGLPFAEAIRTAFRSGSSSGEVWFTNAVIKELPEGDESYPVTVSVRFSYRTVAAA
jgi:hypothetical protein